MSASRGTNVKRVSSAEYENRLNDIATAAFYDRMLPDYEPNPVRETLSGCRTAGRVTDLDGWVCLGAAVIAQGLLDWFEAWERLRERSTYTDSAEWLLQKMQRIEDSITSSGPGETAMMCFKEQIRTADGWELGRLKRVLSKGAHPAGQKLKGADA